MSVFRTHLLPVQKQLLNCNDYFAGIYSGRAAGKTHALSILAARALCEGRNSMLWAQTKSALHNVIFAEVKKRLFEWGLGANIEINESRMSIEMNGTFIRTFSYENVDACREKLKFPNATLTKSHWPQSIYFPPSRPACAARAFIRASGSRQLRRSVLSGMYICSTRAI